MASKIKKKPLTAIIPGNESHRQSEGTATPRHAAVALVRRHEDVFRLDVAVRDLVLVQVRERAPDGTIKIMKRPEFEKPPEYGSVRSRRFEVLRCLHFVDVTRI